MEQFLCPWEAPTFLIFSSNVPTLLYYSHIPALLVSALLALYVFTQRKTLVAKILLFIVAAFAVYNLLDLLIWATNRSDLVMFWWSLQILLEVVVYAGSFYMSYVFIRQRDLPFSKKLLITALLLPLIVLTPTKYNLIGIDLSWCDAIESFVAQYYSYALEFVFLVWTIILGISGMRRMTNRRDRERIKYFTIGIVVFLLALISGNIIGSFTGNWDLAQFGFFGMPIFIAFLTYIIIRFKVFNLRIFGVQALLIALWILLASLFFVQTFSVIRIILSITLVAAIILGIFLIRAVRREIAQRERLEKVTEALEHANEKLKSLDQMKTEFLSLASHQLRSPLTAIKGYASMLIEGAFGTVTEKQQEAAERIFLSSSHLAKVVEDLLNVSKIEQGGMKYEMTVIDLQPVVADLVAEQRIAAEKKGLQLNADLTGSYYVRADSEKLRQVFLNLLDNAIKYTPKGTVSVTLTRKNNNVVFAVADSGMGVTPAAQEKLFEKFNRGSSGATNVGGSGLGLYLAREIITAHNGRIWVESDGTGKGATFFVSLGEVREPSS